MDLLHAVQGLTSWSSAEGHPADFFDRLTYRFTSFIIMCLVALIGLKSYVFQPIQCSLSEPYTNAPAGFEAYSENMCWIENVFRLSRTQVTHVYSDNNEVKFTRLDFDLRSKIRLYQWTPLVLAMQAFFCYLPYMLWLGMQQRAGINLRTVVDTALKASTSADSADRNKQIEFAARCLDECLLMQREYRSGCTFEIRRCFSRLLPCFTGKRSGYLLTFSYVFLKVLFVALPVSQIWFMSRYIGSTMLFGLELFINCTLNTNGTCDHMADGHWASTGLFPLRAGCRVPVMWNHGKDIYWDCALPINFILEKVYVFLWGWFAMLFVFNVVSLFFWLYKLFVPGKRNHFVNKFLRLLVAPDYSNKAARRDFIEKYVRLDGVLVLRLVADIAGDMAAASILLSMWKQFVSNWQLKDSLIIPRGSNNIEMEHIHNTKRRGSKPSATTSSTLNQSPKGNNIGPHSALLMNTDQIAGYPQQ